MRFWDTFGHFYIKSDAFSLDLLDLMETLLDNSILSFMGSIKMGFRAHKTHKSAHNWGSFGHFYI